MTHRKQLFRLIHVQISIHLLLLFSGICTKAADTLQFRYQYGMIIVSGKLNGVDTDFLFDTGSNTTITTPANNTATGITYSKNKIVTRDANNNTQLLNRVQINSIQFGSLEFRNIKGITASMPLLVCKNLVLLGQDVIRQCNWLFDFESQLVVISKQPIPKEAGSTVWNVSYRNGKPYVPIQVTQDTTLQCLIDMGFSGVLDVDKTYPGLERVMKNRQQEGALYQHLTRGGMGLLGYGRYNLEHLFVADSIWLPELNVATLPVNVESNGITKLGIRFFSSACRQLVIHNSTNEYELRLQDTLQWDKKIEDAFIMYENGRLFVQDKNISPGSSAHSLYIGEEVRSVNGKTAADFGTLCGYMEWRFANRYTTIVVERNDGSRLEIRSSVVGPPEKSKTVTRSQRQRQHVLPVLH